MAAVIREGSDPVSLVNLFVVQADQQAGFIDLQLEQTKRFRRHMPGFISSSFHRSLDSVRVLNFAQWRRVEDVQATLRSGTFKQHLDRLAAFDFSNDMHLHDVVFVAADRDARIEVDRSAVADIDVLTVKPASIDGASEAIVTAARHYWSQSRPQGLRSIIILRALDGTGFVIYSQYRAGSPPSGPWIPDLGTHDHRLYEVVSSTVVPQQPE